MRYYYDYNEFLSDLKKLVAMIDWEFDTIVPIARGGLSMAHLMGEHYDIRDVYAINTIGYEDDKKLEHTKLFNIPDLSHRKRVLIVDDISDTGDTLVLVTQELGERYPGVEFRTATIYYKESSLFKPDWYVREAKEWIDFFWTVDLKG